MFTAKELKKAISLYHLSSRSLKPKSKKKYVGVELECILPFPACDRYDDDIGETISDNTGRIILLSLFAANGLEKKVRVGCDGSIRYKKNKECDAEIRILDTEKDIFQTVEKVCTILKEFGARVNKTCGLHVHLDMRHALDDEKEVVFNNFMKAQDYLMSMVSEKRRNSTFCRRIPDKMKMGPVYQRDAFNNIVHRAGYPVVLEPSGKREVTWKTALASRYSFSHHDGLNMVTAYNEQKTFEIRFHEATLDSNAIKKWIATLLKISKVGMLKDKITVETASKKLKLGDNNVRA